MHLIYSLFQSSYSLNVMNEPVIMDLLAREELHI